MKFIDLVEGYRVLPNIDTKRYGNKKHEGLEGPFRAANGKVVYYDPKMGAYYDSDTDMFISNSEWNEMNSDDKKFSHMSMKFEGQAIDPEEFKQKVAASGDAGYEMIIQALKGEYGSQVQSKMAAIYYDVKRDGMKMDDILEIMLDYIEADYIGEDKDPCWKGYRQLGMKKKNGKEVPNCVPESSSHIREGSLKVSRTDLHDLVVQMVQDIDYTDTKTLANIARALGKHVFYQNDKVVLQDPDFDFHKEEVELDESKYGFFGTNNPEIGDMVKHRNGAVGKVKKIGTQGDETFVYFRDQNGEMNYGQWKKHVFPMADTVKKTESLDKDFFHKSVENGEFMKSKRGGAGDENTMFLHDMDNINQDTNKPMLVTFARQVDAEKAAKQYGGKIVKSGMGTFRIIKDSEGLEEGGFFDPDQPNPGDMVKHRNGAVGKIKKIVTQGDETWVHFKDKNGEMNFGMWEKHVFPMNKKEVDLDEEAYDVVRDYMAMGYSRAEAEAEARRRYPKEFEPKRSYRPQQKPVLDHYVFFNVPADKQTDASALGLKQTKNGKWYIGVYNTSGETTQRRIARAEMEFGAGTQWNPKK
jgi:hypothetical protein